MENITPTLQEKKDKAIEIMKKLGIYKPYIRNGCRLPIDNYEKYKRRLNAAPKYLNY